MAKEAEKFPKQVFVFFRDDTDGSLYPDLAESLEDIDVLEPGSPERVGVYELKEVKTVVQKVEVVEVGKKVRHGG